MEEVTIFVEGPADQKLIQDVIESHFGLKLNIKSDIKSFDGKDKWELTKADFEKSTKAGKTNLLIFDADDNCETRRSELLEKKEELGLQFDLFLLPNNVYSGELETLLIEIAGDQSTPIFECFEGYKSCIHSINESYNKPDNKTKIYALSEILTGNGNERKRDYQNKDIWNLDADELKPLINFLNKYFENEA